MDVIASERDPDLDLVASGDITVTFKGPRQLVVPAEDPGHHVASEGGEQ